MSNVDADEKRLRRFSWQFDPLVQPEGGVDITCDGAAIAHTSTLNNAQKLTDHLNTYDSHLATIAAQREVIEAQNSALGRVLSMLKLSLANSPVICADEGIAEAERALELAKGGTGDVKESY